ncbi:MAG: hypothetical protein AAB697_01385 [Patescibacteria group bacterium]
MISDERSLIDFLKCEIKEGSTILSLRESSVCNSHTESLSKYRLPPSRSTGKSYYSLKTQAKYPIKINKALFVFPHFGEINLTVEPINDFILTYMLYENITSTIRSCISVFVADCLGIQSQDNEQLSSIRINNIKKFLTRPTHKGLDITGNLDAICETIIKVVSTL